MRLRNVIKVGDRIRLLPVPGVGECSTWNDTGVIVERIAVQRHEDWMEAARGVMCAFWGISRWPIAYCEKVGES